MRSETRHEHLAELRRLYGFRSFSGGAARELVERLREGGLGDLVSRAGGGLRGRLRASLRAVLLCPPMLTRERERKDGTRASGRAPVSDDSPCMPG